jgi:hypothetical protein
LSEWQAILRERDERFGQLSGERRRLERDNARLLRALQALTSLHVDAHALALACVGVGVGDPAQPGPPGQLLHLRLSAIAE